MNNGQWQISETDAGMRLDRWLSSMRRMGSNLRALDTLNRGKVYINRVEQTAQEAERLLQTGDVVRLWIDPPKFERPDFAPSTFDSLNIVHEDRYILAADKPAGQLTTPHPYYLDEESLFDMIEEYLESKRRRTFIVHRIDRDTTGLVLFAKTLEAQQKLQEQFARREPERIYRAITHGIPRLESGQWHNRIVWNRKKRRFVPACEDDEFALDALCHYRVLERFDRAALIEVALVTGKRNQIRLQAQLHGHPLVGEHVFTEATLRISDIHFSRQALHAYRLNLRHPIRGHKLHLEASLPSDFVELHERLRISGLP